MGRRKREDYNVRSLVKNGSGGITVTVPVLYTFKIFFILQNIFEGLAQWHWSLLTLPIEEIRALKWRSRQKVVVRRSGKRLIIEDWKK